MVSKYTFKILFLLYFLFQVSACLNKPSGSSTDSEGASSGDSGGASGDTGATTGSGAGGTGSGASTGDADITVLDREFVSIAPGGAGAFTVVKVNPNNTKMIVGGTNVGGMMLSTDGGKVFKNISKGTNINFISDAIFTTLSDITYLIVATPMGLYVTNDSSGEGTLGDNWELETSGLEDGYGITDFYHPVLSLSLDPNSSKTVWVGIGFPDSSDDKSSPVFASGEKRCDPYQVYKYNVKLKSFTPVLSLRPTLIGKDRESIKTECSSISSETPSTFGPAVYSIKVHPKDSDMVLFATDMGLYATYDGGTTIYEIGLKIPKKTTNLGKNYTSCTGSDCAVSVSTGESISFQTPRCKTDNITSACLPIRDGMSETHPLVTSVDIVSYNSQTRLFAVILDTDFISSSGGGLCSLTAKGVDDTSFTKFRGGPWYSDDLGKTWKYFYQAKDNAASTIGSLMRCSASADESNTQYTTWYGPIKANPSDRDHVILNSPTIGGNSTSGMWEHRLFTGSTYEWVHFTRTAFGDLCYISAGDSTKNYASKTCYEGNRADDLFRDGKNIYSGMPGLFDVVNWDDEKTRIIYFQNSRGLMKATWQEGSFWSDGIARYYLDHLHTDPVDPSTTNGVMEYWKSSELNDFCPSGGLAFLDDTGTKLVLGGKDAGILLSKDSGGSWKLIRDNVDYKSGWLLPDDFNFDDIDALLTYDKSSQTLYSAIYSTRLKDETNAILKSTDGGEIWEVVGGYCRGVSKTGSCEDSTEDNGFPNSAAPVDMAIDYSRTSKRRLLVGTKENGFYIYDPKATSGSQWAKLTGTNCPSDSTARVGDIWTDESRPKMILATFNTSDFNKDGVYQIKLSDTGNSCTKLMGDSGALTGLLDPSLVAMTTYDGQSYLVASGESHGYPVLFTTEITFSDTNTIDPDSINWDLALDFNYNYSIPTKVASAWEAYIEETNLLWLPEYDHEYFKKKDFAVLQPVPGNPEIIIAALVAKPMSDYSVSGHIYISKDGGLTWAIADEFEDLPTKSMTHIQFSPDSEKIYFSTQCSSLFVECSPFAENSTCSAP